jgi:hypothetical protein
VAQVSLLRLGFFLLAGTPTQGLVALPATIEIRTFKQKSGSQMKEPSSSAEDGSLQLTPEVYAALSSHGSITILVTFSFLSRQTSYMAGASSREIR